MSLKYLLPLTAVVLFSACSKPPNPSQEKIVQLPEWVQHAPQNNAESLWGIGIAQTRERAIKAAIEELVSKIQISLSSSYTLQQRATNYFATKEAKETLHVTVAEITLNHYEIIQTALLTSGEYAVLVRSDKEKLFESLLQKREQKRREIQKDLLALEKKETLFWSKELQQIDNKAQQLLSTAFIAHQLKPNFSTKPDEELKEKIENKLHLAQEQFSIYIESSEANTPYAQTLQNYLRTQELEVTPFAKKESTKLVVNVVTEEKEVYGVALLLSKATLQVFNKEGKLIAKKLYTIRSRPTTQQQKFLQLLQEDPPFEF